MADVEFSTAKPDLEAIENLTPANDDFLQRKAGAWANRTVAQVKTDLAVVGGSTGSTDNSILRADGTGGATVQNTTDKAVITDAGVLGVTGIVGSVDNVQLGAASAAMIHYTDALRLNQFAFLSTGTHYAQITANQNDFARTSWAGCILRLSTDASRDLTGVAPYSAGQDQYIMIVNVGSFDLVLKHESASSTAANRFLNSTGADITLTANQAADFYYDPTSARWRVFKKS